MRPQSPDPYSRKPLGLTRVRDLILFAACASLLSWVLITFNFGYFPIIRWYTGAPLLILTVIELAVALVVRRRVAENEVGQTREQLHPLTVARLVALAKASAILGSIAIGAWGAIVGYLFHLQDVESANASKAGSIIETFSGITLVAAALYLERCCRTPYDPDNAVQEPKPNSA